MASNGLYKTLRVEHVVEQVKGFKTFTFSDGHGIQYKAGQYLTFVKLEHGKEVRRSYSITSSPELNEPLTIGVKRVDNGLFSRMLVDATVAGDELITTGAGGLFVLPETVNNYKQVFFFAAGSGITPVYALIKTLLHAHEHMQVVLVYSNASVEKTVFYKELKALQQQNAHRFNVQWLFSNAVQLSRARLHRKLIEEILEELSIANYGQTLFYTCGPEPYMRLCMYSLQEHDVPKSNIRREDFVINTRQKRDALPPDENPHMVSLVFNKQQFRFTLHYPDSVLQAAKKEGIVLPYSCETGRCGSCVAKCIQGKVWHSYNEVLTDTDLQQGLVLTCVGHPVEGDITLEIE